MINSTIISDNIALLSFNMENSSMNVLNQESISAFETAFDKAVQDAAVKGIVVTSDKKEFIAGADLKMIAAVKTPEQVMEKSAVLHNLYRKIETCGKPVVAAINGTALGGGFELCLACHYRIAINDSKTLIGLPEVLLGLLPGAGGTQRLPRMIGLENSLPLLLEGKKLRPEQALEKGLINKLVANKEELIAAAIEWINTVGKKVQPWDEKGFKIPGGGVQTPTGVKIFMAGGALLQKKTYGNYPAPQAIMNCVYEGLQLDFDRALKVEMRYFTQCAMSQVAKNMIRTLFFTMNAANSGVARPKNIPANTLTKVGILGAGMMGAGIAYVSAVAGLNVVLKDRSVEDAEKGKAYSVKLLTDKINKGHISKEKADEILARITPTADANAVAGCQLVIEAVFEDRALKATVTKESESVIAPTAVYASNTSTLPITGLAEASVRPENFIGLHFFSPVDKMQLVEIILGKKTSEYAIAMAIDYVKRIKKTPIVVNDGRGFFTSRIFSTYIAEGLNMLQEGVAPALIENAGKAAGMPVGPLAVADEVSIELMYKINKQTEKDLGKVNESAEANVGRLFVEKLNRIGKKAGKGFYEYPTDGGKKYLWPRLAEQFPPAKEQPDVELLKKRLLHYQALNAVKCLEENVLTSPADGDIGSILGWGYPPYTGGIFSYIDMVGVRKFVEDCKTLATAYGPRFNPPALLEEMAKSGKKFYEEKAEKVVA